MSDKQLPCPHARPDYRMCPYCMGVNDPVVEEAMSDKAEPLTRTQRALLEGYVRMPGLIAGTTTRFDDEMIAALRAALATIDSLAEQLEAARREIRGLKSSGGLK